MRQALTCLLPLLIASWASAEEPLWLHPRAKPLSIEQSGPFVHVADDGILCVKDDSALISHDDGKSWQSSPLFGDRKFKASSEQALIRTRQGTIVCVFMDSADSRWKWDKQKNTADGEVWLHVWSIRSRDEGKTWIDPVKV